jgi:hypothetical protein
MGEATQLVRTIQQRIADLRRELAALEADLKEARIALSGKGRRKAVTEVAVRRRPIRETSNVGWSRKILQHVGHPLHIDVLIKRIEEMSGLTVRKTTLVSNLSRYVKAHDTFSRPSESIYGLVEWDKKEVA